jgi:hypothetical protein
MFLRLTPAQSTRIHGWGTLLKTTLTWKDVEDRDDVDFDLLIGAGMDTRDLKRLNPDVREWVLHAGCVARHAKQMITWPAHPIADLGGDLSDIIELRSTSKQLKTMGVTYQQLREVGLTPETMRLMNLNFQGWIDMGMTLEDTAAHFSDAQISRVFLLTRSAVTASFKMTHCKNILDGSSCSSSSYGISTD